MHKALLGEKIAVLVANGFEEKDLIAMQKALLPYGANIRIVSMDHGLVNSWNGDGWGLHFAADKALNSALAADFSMLVVPGGRRSLDKLKLTAHTKRFISGFIDAAKPVAFFDEAVELLAFSERASGRTVSGPENVKAEMEQAGAVWSDERFVVDEQMISGVSDQESLADFVLHVSDFFTGAYVAMSEAA